MMMFVLEAIKHPAHKQKLLKNFAEYAINALGFSITILYCVPCSLFIL